VRLRTLIACSLLALALSSAVAMAGPVSPLPPFPAENGCSWDFVFEGWIGCLPVFGWVENC